MNIIDQNPSKFKAISLDELQTPKNNHKALVNHYWIARDNHAYGCNLYGGSNLGNPQCNPDEALTIKMRDRIYKGCGVIKIDAAYWPMENLSL